MVLSLTDDISKNKEFKGIIGIARDGHLIYGPYNNDGEIWHCDDYDSCNGITLANGSYAYVSPIAEP